VEAGDYKVCKHIKKRVMVLKRIMYIALSVFIYIINIVEHLHKNASKVTNQTIGCIKGKKEIKNYVKRRNKRKYRNCCNK